jgi:hypothetical protein
VRLAEGALEAQALAVGHAELLELHHNGVLVEDAHDDRLAMHAGQRDDAQVHMAALDREPDAPVLRDALLRDIQVRHDLHARDDAGGHAPRHGGDVLQHAVDAEAHAHLFAIGREMDIGGVHLHGLGDDLVDELDDGRVVGGLAQIDDLGALLGLSLGDGVGVGDDVLQAIQARDEAFDVLGRGDPDTHLVAGHDRDVVDGEHVGGVGHRHQEGAVVVTRFAAPISTENTLRSRWSRP